MQDFDTSQPGRNEPLELSCRQDLGAECDMLMEEILNNLNSTPLGQVLKQIASLPEVRRKKVLNVRQQLTDNTYDLDRGLNVALDKVLEDLIT
jgi:hypothetical protein